MMRTLLNAGMDVNVRDRDGRTALLYLLTNANDTVILRAKVLLDYGINLNTRDNNNETALAAAWRRGSPDAEIATMLLLEHGADPNARINDEMVQTLLHCAVRQSNRRIVNSLLLRFHADANAKDRDGQTPLHLVAAGFGSGLSQLVTLLSAGGADPCAVDNFGRTPLMLACSHEYSFFTRIDTLLESVEESERVSYVNAQDMFGNCALSYAMASPRGASTVHHLLEASADPFLLDPAGSVVLMGLLRCVTVFNADATLMAIIKLLELGCDPNAPDSSGQTTLHVLAKHPELRQMSQHLLVLLKHGADPTIRDHEGNLPLDYACSNEFDATSVFIVLQHMIGQGIYSST
jgi:ankyrin repeat protein